MSLPSWLKLECFKRDRWHCRHCYSTQNLHPHHITFKSQGGADELWDLVTLCYQCHRDVHEGRLRIVGPEDRVFTASNIFFRSIK
jgi:5-methylcytosine-specific restriction endonuclease McrA